jgi:YggT family protein
MELLIKLFVYILQVFTWAVVIRALSSWFPNARNNPLMQIIYSITDPILKPINKYLPNFGGMDFSPLIAVLIMQGLRGYLNMRFLS